MKIIKFNMQRVAKANKWLNLVTGFLEVAALFAAASFAGYFTIHELKEKDVKKIENKRLLDVRKHLSELATKCSTSKEITKEMEDEFLKLSREEYVNAHEPTHILRSLNFAFLSAMILFLATALLDWANSQNSVFLQDIPLLPIEAEMFFLGIFSLGMGLFDLERLRRITIKEQDLDPAPINVIFFLGLYFAFDMYLLWATGSIYSTLTPFGKALFFSTFLSFPGVILAISTWDKKDWKRALGLILLFAPFFLIFGWFILAVLHFV